MNEKYKKYIKTYTDNLFSSNKKIYVVKHYNTFEITEDNLPVLSDCHSLNGDNVNMYFHDFSGDLMQNAYEPFLNIIADMYQKYYAPYFSSTADTGRSIDDFWAQCNVYPLHYSILTSYINTGVCSREEDLILSEYEYEHDRFLEGIMNTLIKITKEHPVLVYINNINKSASSVIELLNKLLSSNTEHGLRIFAAYNDLRAVLPHISEIWDSFMELLQSNDCIIDSVFTEQLQSDIAGNFRFSSNDVPEYMTKLTNLFFCLDFAQLHYYMYIIYQKLELEKLVIDKEYHFRLLRLYATSSLCVEDVANALLLCDALADIYRKEKSLIMGFHYYYIQSLTQMYNGKHSKAKSCALLCLELAIEARNDFLIFKSKLLQVMAMMSGWHNIFFCSDTLNIDEDFLRLAEHYNYRNHLAHTYIFAYDNDFELYTNVETIDQKLTYFNKGVDIASALGNQQLLIEAYRKNIMLSSSHGAFDISNYYYHKSHELIGNSDPFKEADIYKGWGYNCCATEQYQTAHDHYNKAMHIYYRLGMLNQIGEVLYNMSINCLLSEDFDGAYTYLQTCLKIVNSLHLNDLRVCNISKLFGLLALCSYKLGNTYNCQLYLDYAMQFLSHILFLDTHSTIKNNDPSYTACDDDLFLYYYVNGLLCKDSGKYDKALEQFDKAAIYVERSEGNQFFSYVQFKLALADLYRLMDKNELADTEFRAALTYCEKKGNYINLNKVMAIMSGRPYQPIRYKLVLDGLTIEELNDATKQAAIKKNYNATKKQLDFLNIWQKITDITGKTRYSLIETALNTIATNFSIDAIVFIKYNNGKPKVEFNSSVINLDNKSLLTLTNYFDNHRSGFVTSKMRKNYNEYSTVTSIFDTSKICSIVCVPFYVNEKLDSLFISYICMKDNWNSVTNKYMLDESDLNIFQLSYRQLINALDMLDKQYQISVINRQLENAAITDYLTSLLNRDGFYGNIQKYIDYATKNKERLDLTIMYIDLDNFKFYNDTFGHDVGDLILKNIASLIKRAAGQNGFAVRFGGDEFLIVLRSCDSQLGASIAENILKEIRFHKGYQSDISEMLGREITIPHEKTVSASIGIAVAPNVTCDEDINNALKRADATLYKIKHSTKSDYMVAPYHI